MSVVTRPRIVERPVKTDRERTSDPMSALLTGPLPRRRPKTALVGIGVLAVGALAGALLLSRGTEQRTALVAARNIGAGEVIRTADLKVVRIARDSAIRSLPSTAANEVLDGVASVPIGAGALVLPEQINRTQSAPDGTVLIGTVLEPGGLPSPDLRYGDRVKVLVASQTGGADDTTRIVTEAVVWRVWGNATGSGSKRAVTLAVPDGAAVEVGGAAARNSIRLLVVPNRKASVPPGWPASLTAPNNGPTRSGDPVVGQP